MTSLDDLRAWNDDPNRRIVLAGGHVVTPGGDRPDTDVLLAGDRIEAIGPGLTAAGALVVDVSGRLVLPGFVDSHVHAWEGALRGIAPDNDFAGYMAVTHYGLGPLMTPEDVAIGERITAWQAIDGGVTTIIDNHHNVGTPEHADAAAGALLETGIRAVLAAGHVSAGQPGSALPGDLLRLRDRWSGGRLTVRMMDMTGTEAAWRFAAEHGLGLVAEVGAWLPELDALLATGLANETHTYNHCAGLSGEQWKRVADSGAAVNLAPRSDGHFGLGAFPPVLEAGRHGVEVGISCDNELEYGHDMFTEMRVLLTVQRGLSSAARQRGEADVPAPWGVRDVLRAATAGGARNAGLAGEIGVLAPGAKADVVVLGLDGRRTQPYGSLAGTAVNFADPSNVDTVLIDGAVRKWRGDLVGVDYPALVRAAEASRDRLLSAYGTSIDAVRTATTLAPPPGDGA